jgi:nucleoside transporter
MNVALRVRLSGMMFLEYFIWGAWYVTLGTWLATGLKFSGQQVGWTAGTTAVAAIVSPFLIGLLADRAVATQKVLALLHGAGAILLFGASTQTAFLPIYVLILVYSFCYMPTLALTNSLAFRQMSDPKQQFGPIRALGTIGWIVAGLIIGASGRESTALPMQIAAAASVLMAVYCLTLPDTPPMAKGETGEQRRPMLLEALRVLRGRSMTIFALASLLICIPLQFYYAFTNLFLNEFPIANAAGKMSVGQMSELVCMLLIPWFFRRLGVKYMLAVGMLAWVVRYVCFAYGNSSSLMWMLWLGIILHGICYDFFFVTGQIYIDRQAPVALRAATQGLITQITYGLGMFIGSWLSGVVVDSYAHVSPAGVVSHDWREIWLSAAGFSVVVLVLFVLSFSDREDQQVAERAVTTGVA